MKNFSTVTTEHETRHGVLLSLGPWVTAWLYSVYCRRLEYMVPAPSCWSATATSPTFFMTPRGSPDTVTFYLTSSGAHSGPSLNVNT